MVVVCNLNDETPPNTNWEFLIKTWWVKLF
jgi:hypothetical protein